MYNKIKRSRRYFATVVLASIIFSFVLMGFSTMTAHAYCGPTTNPDIASKTFFSRIVDAIFSPFQPKVAYAWCWPWDWFKPKPSVTPDVVVNIINKNGGPEWESANDVNLNVSPPDILQIVNKSDYSATITGVTNDLLSGFPLTLDSGASANVQCNKTGTVLLGITNSSGQFLVNCQ